MKKRSKINLDQLVEGFAEFKSHPTSSFNQRVDEYIKAISESGDSFAKEQIKVEIFANYLFELLKNPADRSEFLKMDKAFQDEVMALSLFKESRSDSVKSKSTFQVRQKLSELKRLLEIDDNAFFLKAVGREIYLEFELTDEKVEIDKFKTAVSKKSAANLQTIIDSSIGFAFYLLEKQGSEDQKIEELKQSLLSQEGYGQVSGIALYYAVIEEGIDGKTTKKILEKVKSQFSDSPDSLGYLFANALYFIENGNHPNANALQLFLLEQISDHHERAVAVEYFESWSGKTMQIPDVQLLAPAASETEMTFSQGSSIAWHLERLDELLKVNISELSELEKSEFCEQIASIVGDITLVEYQSQSRSIDRDELVDEKRIFDLRFEARRQMETNLKGRKVSQRAKLFYGGDIEKKEFERISYRPNANFYSDMVDLEDISKSSSRVKFPENIEVLIRQNKALIDEMTAEIEKEKQRSNPDQDFIENQQMHIKHREEDIGELREMLNLDAAVKAGIVELEKSTDKEDRLLGSLFTKFEKHMDLIEDVFIATFVKLASVGASEERYGILMKMFPEEFKQEKIDIIVASAMNKVQREMPIHYNSMSDNVMSILGEERMKEVLMVKDKIKDLTSSTVRLTSAAQQLSKAATPNRYGSSLVG